MFFPSHRLSSARAQEGLEGSRSHSLVGQTGLIERTHTGMNEEVRLSRLRVSRRRALSIGGSVGLTGLLAACGADTASSSAASAPATTAAGAASSTAPVGADLIALLDEAATCTLSKEQTPGPYWFDVDSIRTDIREDRPGTTLALALRVQDTSQCISGGNAAPVANSVVEIWHCDAGGRYSGFEPCATGGGRGGGGAPPGGPPPGGTPGAVDSAGETSNGSYSVGDAEAATGDDGTYLRGAQVADSNGVVQFVTIYPGWYRGRTTHIHCKVHIDKKTVLTTQLFIDDTITDQAYTAAPYNEHTGRDTTNSTDNIFDETGLLTIRQQGDGYLGVINMGIDA